MFSFHFQFLHVDRMLAFKNRPFTWVHSMGHRLYDFYENEKKKNAVHWMIGHRIFACDTIILIDFNIIKMVYINHEGERKKINVKVYATFTYLMALY